MSSGQLEQLTPLTEREKRQLTRMLSDPTLYPMAMKSWLIAYLEATDMVLPLSSIAGLNDRLTSIRERTLGGVATGTTDAGGLLHVSLPQEPTSVVVTNRNAAHWNCIFSTTGWDATGFSIAAWNAPANAVLGGTLITVSWLALF